MNYRARLFQAKGHTRKLIQTLIVYKHHSILDTNKVV